MKQGFTLVELSIVLVVIGLVIGGVLAGRDLIKSAQLNRVISDFNQYQVAVGTFKLKYNALPGDMSNATSYWGAAHATPATCATTASTTTATCDGDADGNIEVASVTREAFRFWQHLANAGIVGGQFTGAPASASNWSAVSGTNAPAGPLGGSGWVVVANSDIAQGGWYANFFPPANATNWLHLGGEGADFFLNLLFPTVDAWGIDNKIDDGLPGKGKVTTMNNTAHINCASSDTASSATYQLSTSTSTPACTLEFGF